MTGDPIRPIPRRSVPGGGPSLSLVGFVVEGGPGSGSSPGAIARLRRARAAGVTTFDVAGVRQPAQGRWLLTEAFPERDPELTIIVPAEFVPGAGSPGGRVGDHLPSSIDQSPATLPDLPEELGWSTIVEVNGRTATNTPPAEMELPESAVGTPTRAIRVDPSAERLPGGVGARLYSGSLSLLDPRLVELFEGHARRGQVSLIARDPFAGGRLDGTRLSGNWLERGPAASPSSLRSLAAEFEPVLRLGFLTEGKTRTLAQAALQYAGYRPWVSSVLTPLPTADRLDEILSAFERPPLTENDVVRVERRRTFSPASSRATPLGRSNTD